jgi:hypothetical protein
MHIQTRLAFEVSLNSFEQFDWHISKQSI